MANRRVVKSARITDWLYRHRLVLFGAWLVHTFLLHYFVLGYLSWDGLAYRVGPIIELVQHGGLGKNKISDWALTGYTPFVELAHVPFLLLFKLRGLIIGFPLVVFPLCTYAVFLFVRELSGDRRAGFYAAFAYVAIPMVNQQPYTGYVDFAVAGIMAYWLFSVLRLRGSDESARRTYVRLLVATFLLTMARSQGVYIIVVLFPILAWAMLRGQRRTIVLAAVALLLGSVPAIGLQVYKSIVYGSPIAPMQFQLLGIKLGSGVPISDYFKYAGLGGSDIGSLAKGAFEGWVWHAEWPISAWYASRFMAAGLLTILAFVLLPVFVPSSTRVERWLIAGLLLVSLLSRDFAVPRWSYSIVLVLVLVLGRSLAVLVESGRRPWLFWVALVTLVLHLLRPELDIFQLQEERVITPQLNLSGADTYIKGPFDIPLYPDDGRRFIIIESTAFTVHIYGRELSNKIVRTIPGKKIGPRCETLARYLKRDPNILFIDDQHFSKDCNRTCAFGWNYYCAAWQITPP